MLPEYCIVHKQDIFLREQYRPELQKENLSFLARSFERHFNEREFFAHTCYLFLTKTTRERSRRRSDLSMLCRGRIVPAPMTDAQTLQGFTEAVGQFERILADSGLVSLRRLRDRELTGTRGHAGIIERYLTLSGSETPGLQDIRLDSDRMTVGDKILALYTLSELDDLPALVGTDYRYDRLSTERSDCLLSFAAPVGILLPCEHIYNQMIFLDSPAEILQRRLPVWAATRVTIPSTRRHSSGPPSRAAKEDSRPRSPFTRSPSKRSASSQKRLLIALRRRLSASAWQTDRPDVLSSWTSRTNR